MACKRSEQCEHADICQYAKSNAYDILGGSCYRPKEPQTKQDWLRSLNTEQLAEWIAHQTMIALLENQNNHSLRMTYPAYWVEWLKQPHKGGES